MQVDASGIHSFVASVHLAKSHAINDIFAHMLVSTDVSSTKEPNGLLTADNKRPDGLTFLPWSGGKPLTWDVTVICPLADSHLHISCDTPGAAAKLAATRKIDNMPVCPTRFYFSL